MFSAVQSTEWIVEKLFFSVTVQFLFPILAAVLVCHAHCCLSTETLPGGVSGAPAASVCAAAARQSCGAVAACARVASRPGAQLNGMRMVCVAETMRPMLSLVCMILL